MANIQLCVCGVFGPSPDVEDATPDRVSPCLTTCVEPLSALALGVLPAPRDEVDGAGAGVGAGAGDPSLGGTGDIEDVSCEGGTSARAMDPSRDPVPVDGAATGALLATD